MTQNKILKVALLAGEIMLKNGAETYRVEDTMHRICSASSMDYAETFVTPTGIFISIEDPLSDHPITLVKRIKDRTTNLDKVASVNNLSRLYVSGKINYNTLHTRLIETARDTVYKDWTFILASGFGSGFSTLVFGGKLINFPFSLIIGLLIGMLLLLLSKINLYPFIVNAVAGAFVCSLALIFKKYIPLNLELDKIIIGSIMPMAPGVAITNAVRDYMYGDLVSGTSRASEAFMTAVSVAVCTGIILKFFM